MTNFKRLLAADAAILYGSHRADQAMTVEMLAERKASAIAMLMAADIETSLATKK